MSEIIIHRNLDGFDLARHSKYLLKLLEESLRRKDDLEQKDPDNLKLM